LRTLKVLVLALMGSIDARIPSSHKAPLKFESSWKTDLLSVPLFFSSLVLSNPCHAMSRCCLHNAVHFLWFLGVCPILRCNLFECYWCPSLCNVC
jgi:hypothetical protein